MAEETQGSSDKDEGYAAPHTARSGSVATSPKRKVSIRVNWLVGGAVAILVIAGSFYAGTAYQKHHDKNLATSGKFANGQRGFGGGFGGRRLNGSIGDVTAISSSSITVNDRRSGSAKTYAITSSTQITDNGTSVSYSDIKTGDTVRITADNTSSSNAATIIVNPSFGGPSGGDDNPSSTPQAQ